jgi:hypothetical protein
MADNGNRSRNVSLLAIVHGGPEWPETLLPTARAEMGYGGFALSPNGLFAKPVR